MDPPKPGAVPFKGNRTAMGKSLHYEQKVCIIDKKVYIRGYKSAKKVCVDAKKVCIVAKKVCIIAEKVYIDTIKSLHFSTNSLHHLSNNDRKVY